MTHCDDGALRAYLDGELGPTLTARVERHLVACQPCRTQLAAVGADAAWVGTRLRDLAESSAAAHVEVDSTQALRRLRDVWGAREVRHPARGRKLPGFGARRHTWPVAVAAAGVVLAGGLGLAPVRAAAGNLLQLFRVQHVQVIQVSNTDAAVIRDVLQRQGPTVLDLKNLAHVRVIPGPTGGSWIRKQQSGAAGTPGAGVPMLSPAQARTQLPFPLRVPQSTPGGYALQGVEVQPEFHVEIYGLNVPHINTLLASLGSSDKLPSDWTGADFTMDVPTSAALVYQGPAGQPPIRVVEGGNPSLAVYPTNLDVATVRNILLGLPFLPNDIRAQLQAVSDWQHTALIPQVAGLSQALPVDGTQGAFVHTGDPVGDTALVWLHGDVVYAVEGVLSGAQAQTIANSLN